MKFSSTATALLFSFPMASAFMTPGKKISANLRATAAPEKTEQRPIYDPLGLYPESSEERQQGRIQPMEAPAFRDKAVRDPMGLYPKDSNEFQQALEEEQALLESANDGRPLFDPMGLYKANTPERQQDLIQAMEPQVDTVKVVQDPMGLYPKASSEFQESFELELESRVLKNRDLYDPLGLYPASSAEYQEGKIKVVEPELKVIKPVLDPLGLYSKQQQEEEVDSDAVLSQALPFMAKPALLDGELVGDAGFDPLGLAKSKEGLLWQRSAELKHGRIAMLAAAGWPISELLDQKLASWLHLKPLLVEGDRVPSLLNGGLNQVNPFYWMGIFAVAGIFEAVTMMNKDESIFDPLGLYPEDAQDQRKMQLAELKNGRLAMMAITAFAAIEAITGHSVVEGTPFFFHPPF